VPFLSFLLLGFRLRLHYAETGRRDKLCQVEHPAYGGIKIFVCLEIEQKLLISERKRNEVEINIDMYVEVR
jgi:hypothetical protein